jgi:predicted Holliday junction resolvase-like endonuclease
MTWELLLPVAFLVLALLFLARAYLRLRRKLGETLHSKQSMSVKYGKMTEQFFPFMESYPYDEHNFRFIGNPVDGVQFNEDGIVFIEFKASESRMKPEQKRIRELVESKKVSFREIRIPGRD